MNRLQPPDTERKALADALEQSERNYRAAARRGARDQAAAAQLAQRDAREVWIITGPDGEEIVLHGPREDLIPPTHDDATIARFRREADRCASEARAARRHAAVRLVHASGLRRRESKRAARQPQRASAATAASGAGSGSDGPPAPPDGDDGGEGQAACGARAGGLTCELRVHPRSVKHRSGIVAWSDSDVLVRRGRALRCGGTR